MQCIQKSSRGDAVYLWHPARLPDPGHLNFERVVIFIAARIVGVIKGLSSQALLHRAVTLVCGAHLPVFSFALSSNPMSHDAIGFSCPVSGFYTPLPLMAEAYGSGGDVGEGAIHHVQARTGSRHLVRHRSCAMAVTYALCIKRNTVAWQCC